MAESIETFDKSVARSIAMMGNDGFARHARRIKQKATSSQRIDSVIDHLEVIANYHDKGLLHGAEQILKACRDLKEIAEDIEGKAK